MSQQSQNNPALDAELLQLLSAAATQERGFRLLIKTYGERLYWHIRQMVTWHEAADEVLQNVWVKVFRGIGNFRGDAQLYTWLYRIATNESITFLNKKKREVQLIDDDEKNHALSNQLQADVFFDGDEMQALLQEAIEQLPPKQRQVFNMRYFDELSYKEMSEILDTSEGALKASFHHASKKVEEYLKSRVK